jgi:hypothetical protein
MVSHRHSRFLFGFKTRFTGKPFVVSLWSIDCAPCRLNLDMLGQMKKADPGWYGELPRSYFYDAEHNMMSHSGILTLEKFRELFPY